MEPVTACLLGFALLVLGTAVALGGYSLAALARVLIDQGREHRQQMKEQDEFTIAAMDLHQRELMGAMQELHVSGVLKERGVGPYLRDPASVIQQEVQAVMENLRVDRPAAIAWMLTRIADLRTAPDGIDRTGHGSSGTGLPEGPPAPVREDRQAH